MDDSASQIFFTTRSGYNFKVKHLVMGATAACCLVVAIVGIVMIAKSSGSQTGLLPNQSKKCPSGSVAILDRCFLFAPNNKTTWLEGRNACKALGGDLATIDDCNLMQRVINYIHGNGLEADIGYWIGATDQGHEGSWYWVKGTTVFLGAPFWGTEVLSSFNLEPAGREGQNCLQLYGGDAFTFHDGRCSDSKGVMCEAPSYEGNCPAGFKIIQDKCFNFITSKMTWSAAKSLCAQTSGGHLAHIKDCNLFSDVITYIRQKGLSSSLRTIWLGGDDQGYENIWVWTDGTPIVLGAPFWGKDQLGPVEPNGGTNQNCAAMMKKDRYYFHDVSCYATGLMSPLCEFSV